MSAFEIAITVLLCFIATAVIMLSVSAYRLLERLIVRLDNEKKPASKNEAGEEK